jgi:hypothetical protein
MAAMEDLDLATTLGEINWRINHLARDGNHPRPGEAINALIQQGIPQSEIEKAFSHTDIPPERQRVILQMLSGKTTSLKERTAHLKEAGLLPN